VGSESINLAFDDRESANRAMASLRAMAQRVQADRDVVRLYVNQAATTVPAVVERLQQVSINPISLTITQPTLDDVFLRVTGQRLETQETAPAAAG